MLYEYRLEEPDPNKTAEIEREKDERRKKEEELWKDEENNSNAPPPHNIGGYLIGQNSSLMDNV